MYSQRSLICSDSTHAEYTSHLKSAMKNANCLLAFSLLEIHFSKEMAGTACSVENKTKVLLNNIVVAAILQWLLQS